MEDAGSRRKKSLSDSELNRLEREWESDRSDEGLRQDFIRSLVRHGLYSRLVIAEKVNPDHISGYWKAAAFSIPLEH